MPAPQAPHPAPSRPPRGHRPRSRRRTPLSERSTGGRIGTATTSTSRACARWWSAPGISTTMTTTAAAAAMAAAVVTVGAAAMAEAAAAMVGRPVRRQQQRHGLPRRGADAGATSTSRTRRACGAARARSSTCRILFMRANAGDLGARPIVNAPFWESPDIFVLAGVDPAFAPDLPPALGDVAKAGAPQHALRPHLELRQRRGQRGGGGVLLGQSGAGHHRATRST